jgi:hypothetical protein
MIALERELNAEREKASSLGNETAKVKSPRVQPRILSPLRLPFRQIGATSPGLPNEYLPA